MTILLRYYLQKLNKKYFNFTLTCLIISLVSGLITNDLLMGGTILFTGLLCAYLATEGKRLNYIISLINYLLMGYVSLKNNLYGIAFFYIFIFSSLQISGYITWNKNLDEDNNVIVREFTLKNSCLITISCIIGSFILGYLLSLIPGQRLAILDAGSNCINLCGVVLMILRFKECWWVWITNNIIDLIIWVITVINGGEGSIMMLLVSIAFLLINIYGIIMWNIKAKEGVKNEIL